MGKCLEKLEQFLELFNCAPKGRVFFIFRVSLASREEEIESKPEKCRDQERTAAGKGEMRLN